MKRLRCCAAYCLGLVSIALPAFAHDKIKTVIGGGPSQIPGLSANLPAAGQLALDVQGNLYIAAGSAIYRLAPSGILVHIAGDGSDFYDGDAGKALEIQLSSNLGVAVDNSVPANVFIADTGNCLIRKLDQKTGLLSILAGVVDTSQGTGANSRPSCGFSGDGGPANAAKLAAPKGPAYNPLTGDLYFVDGLTTNLVRKIAGGTALGTISTAAGVFNQFCDTHTHTIVSGALATSTALCLPVSVALDTSVSPVNFFLADPCGIDEVVGSSSRIYHIAGKPDTCGYADNVTATQGQFDSLAEIHIVGNDTSATIQAADTGNGDIRQFSVTLAGGVPQPGILTTIAGAHGSGCSTTGLLALGACMFPTGLAGDSLGNYFIADSAYNDVRKISAANGQIASVVGWDTQSFSGLTYSNPLALKNSIGQPELFVPTAVFADPDSFKVYVGGGGSNAIYAWDSVTSRISGIAGNGTAGFAGDGSLAVAPTTELSYPGGIAKDKNGNIYIADSNNCRIRVVNAATGEISTFAGGESDPANPCGNEGDGGPALSAAFNEPVSLAFNAAGDMFVADQNNCRIRKIDAQTNIVSTVAGRTDTVCGYFAGYSGDGGPATSAQLCMPSSISVDGAGNLYIADFCNHVIREVLASTGIIQTFAGVGNFPGFTGDGPAAAEELDWPSWVKADKNGNLFIADEGNNLVRWVTPAGQMVTFAGLPLPSDFPNTNCPGGFFGDGGLALNALLDLPSSVDQDAAGNFYVVDQCNNRIRQISAFPGYGLSTESLQFIDPQKIGTVSASQTITVSAIGPIKISVITLSHGFTETDNCEHTELATGQTCQIQVSFDPRVAGYTTGNLKIYSNALLADPSLITYPSLRGNPNTVTLYGTGQK